MTNRQAEDRAKFFANYLFDFTSVPEIEVVTQKEIFEILEEQMLETGVIEKFEDAPSGMFFHTEYGYGDDDECTIYINKAKCKTVEQFNGTLIHELLHYVLWWQGYDSDDGEKDFEDGLKKLGLASNYDLQWDENKKCSKRPNDSVKLAEYETAYQEYLKEKKGKKK